MTKRKPSDIKYSPNHSWVRLEGQKEVIIGITDHIIKGWTDIVSVDLPKRGEKIKQDSSFAEIKSEDNFFSIIVPLSGKVLAVNKDVLKNPSLILEEPYDDGWLVRVRMDDISEFTSMMFRRDYEKLIEEEDEENKPIYEESLGEDEG